MQELIKVYAQTPEKGERFRAALIKAEFYFPKLSDWCPPIYVGVTPPGGLLRTGHYVADDLSYIYVAEVDIIPGWDDFDAQIKFVHHEIAHTFEIKFMGRNRATCDERFAAVCHNAVVAENELLYVMLSHMMA